LAGACAIRKSPFRKTPRNDLRRNDRLATSGTLDAERRDHPGTCLIVQKRDGICARRRPRDQPRPTSQKYFAEPGLTGRRGERRRRKADEAISTNRKARCLCRRPKRPVLPSNGFRLEQGLQLPRCDHKDYRRPTPKPPFLSGGPAGVNSLRSPARVAEQDLLSCVNHIAVPHARFLCSRGTSSHWRRGIFPV
jgi:hypothetical protein